MEPRTEAGRALPANVAQVIREQLPMVERNERLLKIAAIIEAEAAASPVLDVERLAEAIDRVAVDVDQHEGLVVSSGHAEDIAREYAALESEVEHE